MSPARDMSRGLPTSRDLQVWLTFEQDGAGVLVERLAVEQPDGWLVELDLAGDDLPRLLAGQTLTVAGEVSVIERPDDEELGIELGAVEPEVLVEVAER